MEHLSVVLESTGGAAEHIGGLGEFQLQGSYGGRPSYLQRDVEGSKKTFLYYESDAWYVSPTLGGTAAWLWNSQDTQDPPADKWNYSNSGFHADPSLVLRGGPLEPCREVKVAATGEVRRLKGDCLGSYLPTGRWSQGRPVYRQVTAS